MPPQLLKVIVARCRRLLWQRSDSSTAMNAVQLALEGLSQTLPDATPFSMLKVAVDGLLFVITTIEKTRQNQADLDAFATHLNSLTRILSEYRENEFPPIVDDAISQLTKTVTESLSEIQIIMSHGQLKRLINSSGNAQTLAIQNATIVRSLSTFHTASAFVLLRQTDKIMTNSDRAMLDKIPIAQGALYDSSERNFANSCLKDTRVSLLNQIMTWISDPTSPHIFWLNGMAENKWLAATFFFSRDRVVHHSADLFFPTIARQLANFEPRVIPFLTASMKTNSTLPLATFQIQLTKLIVEPLIEFQESLPSDSDLPMVIIVDALDECKYEDSASEIVNLLISGGLHRFPFLKVLVTSRPESHILSVFQRTGDNIAYRAFALHEMNPDDVRKDIAIYLEQGLKKLQHDRRECFTSLEGSWPSEETMKSLVDKSAGLFIYASTTLYFIGNNRQNPRRQLELVLGLNNSDNASAYGHLDELYRQIVGKCSSSEHFRTILSAILFAAHPLSARDLEMLLDLQPGDVRIALYDLQSVFVIPTSDNLPIRLFHPSFYDFLTTKERSGKFYLDPHVGQSQMATACFTHFTGYCDDRALPLEELSDAEIRLLRYACEHWTSHLRQANFGDRSLLETSQQFLSLFLFPWFNLLVALDLLSFLTKSLVDLYSWVEGSNLNGDLFHLMTDTMDQLSIFIAKRFSYHHDALSLASVIHRLVCDGHESSVVAPEYLYHRGDILRLCYLRHRNHERLDDAIEFHREAIKLLPNNHVDRPIFLMALAICLRTRSRLGFRDTPEDVPECLTLCENACHTLADSHPHKPPLWTCLAFCHKARYKKTTDIGDLDMAIELHRRAATSLAIDYIHKVAFLCNTGASLRKRFRQANRETDVTDAVKVFHEAISCPSAAPSVSYKAAAGYAECMELLEQQSCLSAYVDAVSKARGIIWTALTPPKGERLLRKVIKFALKAGSLAIAVDDYWTALDCIDQACIMHWRDSLQITDSHPFLLRDAPVRQMEKLAAVLEIGNAREPIPPLSTDDSATYGVPDFVSLCEEYRRLKVVADCQWRKHIDCLHTWLRSTNNVLSSTGHIIILNGSNLRCDALVIQPYVMDQKEVVVPLPINYEDATNMAKRVRHLWKKFRIPREGEYSEKLGKGVLRDIWESIVQPILSAIRLQPAQSRYPPRIWWCLTGPFMDLPVHAAGTYDHSHPLYLTDFAVSSYIPSPSMLFKLQEARDSSDDSKTPPKLFFMEPDTTPTDRSVALELDYMREIIPAVQFTTTSTQKLSLDNVISQMSTCTGVHIAARSEQRRGKPTCADFVMPGNLRLGLSHLRDNPVPTFAFLSTYTESNEFDWGTCRTAYDLLNVGFTSVIGAQGPITSNSAAEISALFYTFLEEQGGLDFHNAATALHSAIVFMREEGANMPLKDWVRYIHVGI